MESIPPLPSSSTSAVDDVGAQKDKEAYTSLVDPFLVEALQNPRHRLTILRMELDIQNFLLNRDQQQFEFQHFPTSYLRLAAHRVAQHYGLQTMVQENFLDGQGNRIVVRKLPESRYPPICLSDILPKQSENKHEQVKIVLRPRPSKGSADETNDFGVKCSHLRTVEERKEDYDRARARIFSSLSSSAESEDTFSRGPSDGKNLCSSLDENEGSRNFVMDSEKHLIFSRDGGSSSRVAIFRDREKDRSDPDYDRSYERYIKNIPTSQNFTLPPFNIQKFQPSYVQYDSVVPQLCQMPRTQASLSYRSPVMSPFCAQGLTHSGDAAYMQWPTHGMMYAQSYDQFRQAVFQAPFFQQPLSFDYSQNH